MARLMKALEVLLALAFVFAVLLNFANVIGRYVIGRSISGADEVQVYIMVAMAFLGAAIVAWRRNHLRMDVLAKRLPDAARTALRYAELAAVVVLAGFTAFESYRYAAQMAALGRTSDVAGIPMWIPQGTVALGFALIAVIGLLEAIRRR